jgi:CRISPR-associated protein Cas1
LNYGYSIILSAINREVKQFGYLTEFGIHHIGVNNPFNLSCDLMEPLRPLIDFQVLSKEVTIDDFKVKMAALLGKKISYDSSEMFLDNAIHLYVQNCLNVLGSGKLDKVIFPVYELA